MQFFGGAGTGLMTGMMQNQPAAPQQGGFRDSPHMGGAASETVARGAPRVLYIPYFGPGE